MRQHKVFLRHELLKYNSEKSTAKSSALENYISSANLSLSGCSSAEPNSVSVGRCKFQLKKLYLQTVKKVDHLPDYIFQYVDLVKFHVGAENWRSRKAMEKLGAEFKGEVMVAYHGEPTKQNVEYWIKKENWK